jgi:hypothetical protein
MTEETGRDSALRCPRRVQRCNHILRGSGRQSAPTFPFIEMIGLTFDAAKFPNNSARSARAGTPQRGVPTTIIRHVHNPSFFANPELGVLVSWWLK